MYTGRCCQDQPIPVVVVLTRHSYWWNNVHPTAISHGISSQHTYRFGLVSEEVNGGVVLLNKPQAESLIPTIRKHIKADLPACRKTKVERQGEIIWTIYSTLTKKADILYYLKSGATTDHFVFPTDVTSSKLMQTLYNCQECSRLTDWKWQSFAFELFL